MSSARGLERHPGIICLPSPVSSWSYGARHCRHCRPGQASAVVPSHFLSLAIPTPRSSSAARVEISDDDDDDDDGAV